MPACKSSRCRSVKTIAHSHNNRNRNTNKSSGVVVAATVCSCDESSLFNTPTLTFMCRRRGEGGSCVSKNARWRHPSFIPALDFFRMDAPARLEGVVRCEFETELLDSFDSIRLTSCLGLTGAPLAFWAHPTPLSRCIALALSMKDLVHTVMKTLRRRVPPIILEIIE